jgi:hypothetical protein
MLRCTQRSSDSRQRMITLRISRPAPAVIAAGRGVPYFSRARIASLLREVTSCELNANSVVPRARTR